MQNWISNTKSSDLIIQSPNYLHNFYITVYDSLSRLDQFNDINCLEKLPFWKEISMRSMHSDYIY